MHRRILCTVVYILAATAAIAQAPAAQPSGFGALGGTIFASAHGNPQAGLGYPVAEWNSVFGTIFHGRMSWGHGTLVGIVTTSDVGLGLGHRFNDFISVQGQKVSFTIGPAFTIRWKARTAAPAVAGSPAVPAERAGLAGRTVGIFATVALFSPKPAAPPAQVPPPPAPLVRPPDVIPVAKPPAAAPAPTLPPEFLPPPLEPR